MQGMEPREGRTEQMNEPFKPVDGVTPRWQKLYDLVMTRKVGEEVTYGEAQDLLQCNRALAQNVMRETQRRLELNGERTIGTVTNFGWIVLDASRELRMVDRRLTKTRRAAGRVVRGTTALNTRREELGQFDRERLDQLGHAGRMIQQITGRKKVNVDDLRKSIEGSTT